MRCRGGYFDKLRKVESEYDSEWRTATAQGVGYYTVPHCEKMPFHGLHLIEACFCRFHFEKSKKVCCAKLLPFNKYFSGGTVKYLAECENLPNFEQEKGAFAPAYANSIY